MIFVSKDEVLRIHARALEMFGGAAGIRDEGALEAALVAAENRVWYDAADIIACAATYAYHLTMADAFVDGNKWVAAVMSEAFLVANECHIEVSDDELYDFFMTIASGDLSRDAADAWLRGRVRSVLTG